MMTMDGNTCIQSYRSRSRQQVSYNACLVVHALFVGFTDATRVQRMLLNKLQCMHARIDQPDANGSPAGADQLVDPACIVLGAETGSGKTLGKFCCGRQLYHVMRREAYLVPMLDAYLRHGRMESPFGLVFAPSVELAGQVALERSACVG